MHPLSNPSGDLACIMFGEGSFNLLNYILTTIQLPILISYNNELSDSFRKFRGRVACFLLLNCTHYTSCIDLIIPHFEHLLGAKLIDSSIQRTLFKSVIKMLLPNCIPSRLRGWVVATLSSPWLISPMLQT